MRCQELRQSPASFLVSTSCVRHPLESEGGRVSLMFFDPFTAAIHSNSLMNTLFINCGYESCYIICSVSLCYARFSIVGP